MEGFLCHFAAVSVSWVSGQPSDMTLEILMNKPMNLYLLRDLEADAEDSLLKGTLHWDCFSMASESMTASPSSGLERLGGYSGESVSTWWFLS